MSDGRIVCHHGRDVGCLECWQEDMIEDREEAAQTARLRTALAEARGLMERASGPVSTAVGYWTDQERQSVAAENKLICRTQRNTDRTLLSDIDTWLEAHR